MIDGSGIIESDRAFKKCMYQSRFHKILCILELDSTSLCLHSFRRKPCMSMIFPDRRREGQSVKSSVLTICNCCGETFRTRSVVKNRNAKPLRPLHDTLCLRSSYRFWLDVHKESLQYCSSGPQQLLIPRSRRSIIEGSQEP